MIDEDSMPFLERKGNNMSTECKFPQYINPKLDTFYDCFWYLESTAFFSDPEFIGKDGVSEVSVFSKNLNLNVWKVNRITGEIENDSTVNTELAFVAEVGGKVFDNMFDRYIGCHYSNLDCSAKTYEKMIIKIANLVEDNYPLRDYGKISHFMIDDDYEDMKTKFGEYEALILFTKKYNIK